MIGTLAVNLLVVRYEAGQGRALKSELLLADAAHTQSDVWTSCAVLASLAAVKLGFPAIDSVGAVVIAVFIARTGLHIGMETSGILADRVVLDEEQIRRVVMSVPDVLGCHQIRTRGTYDHTFLDLHVWFAADTTLYEAHRLSHVVKDQLMEAFPQIADAIIHIEPPPLDSLGRRPTPNLQLPTSNELPTPNLQANSEANLEVDVIHRRSAQSPAATSPPRPFASLSVTA